MSEMGPTIILFPARTAAFEGRAGVSEQGPGEGSRGGWEGRREELSAREGRAAE